MPTIGSPSNPYLNQMRIRAARRKSRWNLLLLGFAVVGVAASWILIVLLLDKYRSSLALSGSFLGGSTRFGNILMHVSPGLPSIALGFILANLLIWCIPPARTALANEAKGFPGTDFRSSNLALLKGLAFLAGVTFPLAFLGARNAWSIAPQTLSYQPMFTSTAKEFSWSDIRAINTGCRFSRQSLDRNFVVEMRDGTTFDLSEEAPREFLAEYPLIQTALTGHDYQFNPEKVIGSCTAALSPIWTRILIERPTTLSH
jgi:hypothetical protein